MSAWYPSNEYGLAAFRGHLRWEHGADCTDKQSADHFDGLKTFRQITMRKGQRHSSIHPEHTFVKVMTMLALRDILYRFPPHLPLTCSRYLELQPPCPEWLGVGDLPMVETNATVGCLDRGLYFYLGEQRQPNLPQRQDFSERLSILIASAAEEAARQDISHAPRGPATLATAALAPNPTVAQPLTSLDYRQAGLWVFLPDDCKDVISVYAREEGAREGFPIDPRNMSLGAIRALNMLLHRACEGQALFGEFDYDASVGLPLVPKMTPPSTRGNAGRK